MSRIDEMVAKLCPDGVVYKRLGEVCIRQKGMPITAAKMKEIADESGDILVFGGGKTKVCTKRESLPRTNVIEVPSVVVKSRGNIGFEYCDVPFTNKNELWSYAAANPNVDIKFISYYLESNRDYFQEAAKSGKLPQISTGVTDDFKIPVPPMEIQLEIVRILDSFTELETELEAELEARKSQYALYRDELLSQANLEKLDGHPVEMRTIQDISKNICSGGTPSSKNSSYYGGDIPWVRTQDVDYGIIDNPGAFITKAGLDNSSAKWIPAGCVIVAMYGATAAKVAMNAIPVTTNQACCNIEVNSEAVSARFVFHWLAAQYEVLKAQGEGSQNNISGRKVRNFSIPVPSLATQQRIVDILDRFDALTMSLTDGLPAEITARRQQYEHYRDRLLDFPRKSEKKAA